MKTILIPNIMRLKFLMKRLKFHITRLKFLIMCLKFLIMRLKFLMKHRKSLLWRQIILFVLFPTEKRGLHSISPSTTNIKNQGTTISSTLISLYICNLIITSLPQSQRPECFPCRVSVKCFGRHRLR